MGQTVLAGPIVFSPAEIAFVVAVLAGVFVVVTAPGWALVAVAASRRRRAQRPGPAVGAAVGGAVGGLTVCGAVCALVGVVAQGAGTAAIVLAVLASWAVCALLALRLTPRTEPDRVPEGWGR